MRTGGRGCVLVAIEQNKAGYENLETGVLTLVSYSRSIVRAKFAQKQNAGNALC
jgi:hypothetical protein